MSAEDKAKNTAEKATAIKEGAGKVTGNESLQPKAEATRPRATSSKQARKSKTP